jgi:hypothetical protein
METEDSSPCSQEPATSLYPEPDESSPYHSILFFKYIVILFSHLRFCLTSVSFPSGFPILTHYAGLSLVHECFVLEDNICKISL